MNRMATYAKKILLGAGLALSALVAATVVMRSDVFVIWRETPFWVHSTSWLVSDPVTRKHVNDLARFQRVERDEGDIYSAYTALAGHVSKDDVFKLLRHESPVVRAYMAHRVIHQWPEEFRRLHKLVDDRALITSKDGCRGAQMTLGAWILEELRLDPMLLDHAEIEAFVLDIASDPHAPLQREAQWCVEAAAERRFERSHRP